MRISSTISSLGFSPCCASEDRDCESASVAEADPLTEGLRIVRPHRTVSNPQQKPRHVQQSDPYWAAIFRGNSAGGAPETGGWRPSSRGIRSGYPKEGWRVARLHGYFWPPFVGTRVVVDSRRAHARECSKESKGQRWRFPREVVLHSGDGAQVQTLPILRGLSILVWV